MAEGVIVALGDSLTFGFPYSPGSSWVAEAEALLGRPIVNRGVNGEASFDMVARVKEDVLSLQPACVVILAGSNDALRGGVRWAETETSLLALAAAVEEVGAQVVFGLPPALDDPAAEERLKRQRAWLKEEARGAAGRSSTFLRRFSTRPRAGSTPSSPSTVSILPGKGTGAWGRRRPRCWPAWGSAPAKRRKVKRKGGSKMSEAMHLVAELMALAARTAPKAGGKDYVGMRILEGGDLARLADAMVAYGKESGKKNFDRDGENVRRSDAVLLLSLDRPQVAGLNCGACGYPLARSWPSSTKDPNSPVPCAPGASWTWASPWAPPPKRPAFLTPTTASCTGSVWRHGGWGS